MVHWVVVADASRAKIFRSESLLQTFSLEVEHVHPEGRMRSSELATDGQGRNRAGGRRASHAPHTDPHDVTVHAFARDLAAEIRKGRTDGSYERLILAAPPRFLGMLRDCLDVPTRRTIVASLAQDWTKQPDHELPAIIRDAMPETAGLPDSP